MTAPDPRLDDIQARLDAVTEWRRHFHAPHNLVDYSQRDVPFLLAELRKAREALANLSDWAGRNKTGYYDEAQDDVVQIIRAAVAAAKGDERG